MPGWHEATSELQREGKVKTVGIVEEQHPERARLFMQWKKMDWPVLIDSYNMLGVSAVPITVFVDEYGIVRHVRPKLEDLQEFLNATYENPGNAAQQRPLAPDLGRLKPPTERDSAEAWRTYGDALALWGSASQLTQVIEAYERALNRKTGDGPTHFRLGVAYRKRYDSSDREREDFQQAVQHWTRALEVNPNQYIWRRRIQQYGPRLDKPYSFYDWVREARREIESRGETPLALSVEPGGAEFAHPSEDFKSVPSRAEEPDPRGRILGDERGFIEIEKAVVPAAVAAGKALRVHLTLRPNSSIKAHWNNEVEDLLVWIDPPEGWRIDQHYLTVPNPSRPVSQETRIVEFELQSPETASPGRAAIGGYALYYVCEDVDGTCLYRRQDISIPVTVKVEQ